MKAPKVKRVKAERIRHYWSGYDAGFYEERWSLPADAESYAKLVRQVDEAVERGINRWLAGTAGPDGCKRLPHEVLKSIGITPRTGRGGKDKDMGRTIVELRAALAAAQATAREATEDKERLDWLASKCYYPYDHPQDGVFVVVSEHSAPHGAFTLERDGDRKALRAAIDAARRPQP